MSYEIIFSNVLRRNVQPCSSLEEVNAKYALWIGGSRALDEILGGLPLPQGCTFSFRSEREPIGEGEIRFIILSTPESMNAEHRAVLVKQVAEATALTAFDLHPDTPQPFYRPSTAYQDPPESKP